MSAAARLHPHRRRRRLVPGINLTPMLDMIFNLLFFFILATNIRQDVSQMNIQLPQTRSGSPVTQPEQDPVIAIDAQDRVFFEDRLMVDEELQLELAALARQGTRRLRLQADEQARHGRVVQVMELCRLAGIDDILWDVKPAPGARTLPPGVAP